MDEIIETLKKCGFNDNNWINLGLKLGLLYTTLLEIESDCCQVDRCLMQCLFKWLKRDDNVDTKGGLPSWSSLSYALSKIDMVSVANNLNKLGKSN